MQIINILITKAVFSAYLKNNQGKELSIGNISTQAYTQEIKKSDPIYISNTYRINQSPELQLVFTTEVAVDKSLTAVLINLGLNKPYQVSQINSDDGALINLSDGIYILPNIFKYFTTDYSKSKNQDFKIKMTGFDYSQTVQFDLSLVENMQNPLYPKMETRKIIFEIVPLQILSTSVITIPTTSSSLVGDNSIYWIDFNLQKGFLQSNTIQVKYDSSTILITDFKATKIYDKTNPSYILIETAAQLDTNNSILSLTHSNFASTAQLEKKNLRLELSVRNPLSIKSKINFVILSVQTADTTKVFEKLESNLSVTLLPNLLQSLEFLPLNPIVSQISTYKVKFGVQTIIPKGGTIKIILPPDIDLPFYKVGGTQSGSLNTVEPVSTNISVLATIELDQYPCATSGCIAIIKNGIQNSIAKDSIVEFKLNYIRNLFSTKPASALVSTQDQNGSIIDKRETQFEMTQPNKLNFVQINSETSVVGMKSYYDFNIQFNSTHQDGYILYITYPTEIQPILQNANDLNCIGLDTTNGLVQDLKEKDESCVVRNVDGVNKIQIKLKFKNPKTPSRTIGLRVSSFQNYYLANKDLYFGLETVIRESYGDNQYNNFYIEKLTNDPTLKVQMTANTFTSLSVSATPGIMDQENDIIINLTPTTIPKSTSTDTFYIRIQLSPLLNLNTNVCTNYFVPPSNTKFESCVYQNNAFSIPFTVKFYLCFIIEYIFYNFLLNIYYNF